MYYTYAYLRLDGTPYYIGKGRGKRAYSDNHRIGLPSPDRIKILDYFDVEEDAINEEIRLIKHYGRKDKGNGILRNQTWGGDGSSQYLTEEEAREAQLKCMRNFAQKKRDRERAEDIDEYKRKRREYREANREKINEKKRGYYQKNREEELRKKKEKYATQEEKDRVKQYRAENREMLLERQRGRYWANPEAGRERTRKYRERLTK